VETSGPFWVRWGIRRTAGWPLGAAALGALTWALAAAAQHAAVVAARPETADLYTYSLGGHVAGMTLLGCAAVLVASALVRQRHRVMAGAVLAGTAAGPMTLIAAPVRWSLVAPNSGDTVWWWHLAIGAVVFAVLAAWTVTVATAQVVPVGTASGPRSAVSDEAVFFLVAAVGFACCWNFAWHLQESPGALPALGWAALVAGVAVAFARAQWRTCAILIPLIAAALGVMAWAYLRDGGWPGVAGWEFNGMESPVVLSARVTFAVAAGPLLGLGLRGLRLVINRRSAPATASRAAVAT
jgi:hypothetical protein